jgi:hypothetical protein
MIIKSPFGAAPPAARPPTPPLPATPPPALWRGAQRAAAASPERPGAGVARPSTAWTCCSGSRRVEPQGVCGAKASGRAAEGGRMQTGVQTPSGVVLSRDTPLLHAHRFRGHAQRRGSVGCTTN